MRTARAVLVHFGVVFAAGFVLGLVRVPLLVPHVGDRIAELIEAPFLLVVIFFSGRWIARHPLRGAGAMSHVIAGLAALALMLALELTVVLALRGLSVTESLRERDPVAGLFYAVMLGVFALMPLLNRRSS